MKQRYYDAKTGEERHDGARSPVAGRRMPPMPPIPVGNLGQPGPVPGASGSGAGSGRLISPQPPGGPVPIGGAPAGPMPAQPMPRPPMHGPMPPIQVGPVPNDRPPMPRGPMPAQPAGPAMGAFDAKKKKKVKKPIENPKHEAKESPALEAKEHELDQELMTDGSAPGAQGSYREQ